jgi:NADH-quinone oxidoreductase subunit K
MTEISLESGLALSSVLFTVGLAGVLFKRNLIYLLISVEIMLNAAGLAFVIAGSHWEKADGQIMFIFILAIAAAGVSVGLALTILVYRKYRTLDTGRLDHLKG